MYEAFEEDPVQPVITRFHLIKAWKTGHCVDRDPFAFLNLAVGECRVEVELLRDGSLKLPAGVRVAADVRRRATLEARRMAVEELAAEWREQRDQGADGRYLAPGDP
jgi:hypothetical protein